VSEGTTLLRGCLKGGKRVGTWIGQTEQPGRFQVLEYTWRGKLRVRREVKDNRNIKFEIFDNEGRPLEPPKR